MDTPDEIPTEDPIRSGPGKPEKRTLTSSEEGERLEVIDRVLTRSRIRKSSRAGKLRLRLAMYKVRRNLQNCTFDELERIVQEETAAEAIQRKPPTPISESQLRFTMPASSTCLEIQGSQRTHPPPILQQASPRYSKGDRHKSNGRVPSILPNLQDHRESREPRDTDQPVTGDPPTPAQVAAMMLLLHSSPPNTEHEHLNQRNLNIHFDGPSANASSTGYDEYRNFTSQGPAYTSPQKWGPPTAGPYPTDQRQKMQSKQRPAKQGRQRSISTSVAELAERSGTIRRPVGRPRSYSANKRNAPPAITSNIAPNLHTTATVLSPYNNRSGGQESSFFAWQFIEEDGTTPSTKYGGKSSRADRTIQPAQQIDNHPILSHRSPAEASTRVYDARLAYDPLRRGPPLHPVNQSHEQHIHNIGNQHTFAPSPAERPHFSMTSDYPRGMHPSQHWMTGSHPLGVETENSVRLPLPRAVERKDFAQSRGDGNSMQAMESNALNSRENPSSSPWITHEDPSRRTFQLPPPMPFDSHENSGRSHYGNVPLSGATNRYFPYHFRPDPHSQRHDWAPPPIAGAYDRTAVQNFPQQSVPFPDNRLDQRMHAQPPILPRLQLPPLEQHSSSYEQSDRRHPNYPASYGQSQR